MGTERYQLRETEYQAIREALFSAITNQMDGEDEEWDPVIYDLSCLLLRILPAVPAIVSAVKKKLHENDASWIGETHGQIVARQLFEMHTSKTLRMRGAMVIATIARFSHTEEEAEMLAWQFFEKLCKSLASRFTRDYLAQAVHHPEKVYGGPTMDDVPEAEDHRRMAAIENAEAWVIKPT